ncbi:MAG: hypothetical protein MI861_03160 [Pirellulales bacterium]|nr:hypothetical protein [Pirellulales bacterium]
MNQNPYSPPRIESSIADPTSEVIRFEGEVELDDLARLIRTPRGLIVLRAAIALLITPFIGLGFAMATMETGRRGASLMMVSILMILGALLIVALQLWNRRRRAQRWVKQHPQLLGPIRGKLDVDGLTWFNFQSHESQLVTWAAFPEVAVTRHGIRLDWRTWGHAFVAIPARCIDQFECLQVHQAVSQLRSMSDQPAIYQSIPDWDRVPAGAIRFEHTIWPAQASRRDLSILQRWLQVVCATCCLVIACLIGMGRQGYLLELMMAALVSGGAAFVLADYRDQLDLTLRRWGWLNRSGGECCLPGTRQLFQWMTLENIAVDPDHLQFTLDDGSMVRLTPEDLLDGDWPTLIDWVIGRQ